jgi:hypothetical protein
MEHKQGGSYTGRPGRTCRCDTCRADHARRAREYRQKYPERTPAARMKLELSQLREQVSAMRAILGGGQVTP